MSNPTTKRLHATITGRVQGVGFRWFVIKHAGFLGLNGWTKNLPDGRVEVMAEGNESDLQALLVKLRAGTGFSQVLEVDFEYLEPTGMTGGFDVKY
jgi:acylphosphatase